MPLPSDRIIERQRLRQALIRWRSLALIGFLLAFYLFAIDSSPFKTNDMIARVTIEGIIMDEPYQQKVLNDLKKNPSVKAVIVHIDSPGGTALGGEALYTTLRDLRETKPVIAVMRTMATSAGYMIALGANEIVASKSTLTGSIGVILQLPSVEKLAEKVGIKMDYIRTSPLKGAPTPFEQMTPEVRQLMESVVLDFQKVFVEMVQTERKMSDAEVKAVSDGRVFTGQQAIALKLIDSIGDEKTAQKILSEKYKLHPKLEIQDVSLTEPEDFWGQMMQSVVPNNLLMQKSFFLHGLLSIWPNVVM